MTDPFFILQLVINGLTIGAIYALIAAGLSLVFGVIGIVNFAHGEFYMLAAMLASYLVSALGLGYWPMVALVVVAALCLGAVLYDSLLMWLEGQDFERSVLATMGLAMVLQNGAIFLFTTTPRSVRTEYAFVTYSFGEVDIALLRGLAFVLAAIAFVLVWAFLHRTQLGRAMRGVAQNRQAALMVGIDPRRVARIAVATGIGLAGLAGGALAPIYAVHPLMGTAFVFKAFAIVIIGGLGNFAGSVAAAMMIGVIESLVGSFFSLVTADAMSFAFMILVLLFRPEGLFGRGVRV